MTVTVAVEVSFSKALGNNNEIIVKITVTTTRIQLKENRIPIEKTTAKKYIKPFLIGVKYLVVS